MVRRWLGHLAYVLDRWLDSLLDAQLPLDWRGPLADDEPVE